MTDSTHKNILAILHHSNETRKLIRELEKKIAQLEDKLKMIPVLESQIQALQVKVYTGGSTS
jgi:uncharacterized protein involved in exopolysaccharide biosynthesis